MKVLTGPWDSWKSEPTAVAIGVFDGVHLGHRAVLTYVMNDGLAPAVLTFEPHPVSVIAPDHAPLILTPLRRKLELFEGAGIEAVGVVTFDEAVRQMDPATFSSEVLVGGLASRRVVVGADFHFGKDRAGTPEVLADVGAELGFEVTVVPLVGGEEVISSSGIRAALAAGRVEDAARWLGRPFRATGKVTRGENRGATIGFPTANLTLEPGLAVPGRGVYAVRAHVDGADHPAVANVGVRPTFGGTDEVLEVHLLDFSGDLYGREVSVDFISRIRDELEFDSVDDLVAQIEADVASARRIHTP